MRRLSVVVGGPQTGRATAGGGQGRRGKSGRAHVTAPHHTPLTGTGEVPRHALIPRQAKLEERSHRAEGAHPALLCVHVRSDGRLNLRCSHAKSQGRGARLVARRHGSASEHARTHRPS